MDKITIQTSNKKVMLGIENIKYLIDDKFDTVFEIIQVFKKVFSKTNDSEFDLEGQTTWIKFNDNPIDLKRNMLWYINEHFDLETDLKLGSKSMTLKFFESRLSKVEYHELSSTIQSLFESFSEHITDLVNENIKNEMILKLNDFTFKTILKNLEPQIIKDNSIINSYNMTYEEIIIYQLSLAKEIAKENMMQTIWLIITIPNMTKSIYEELKVVHKNMKVIIYTNKLNDYSIDENQILIINNKILDLSSEIELYNEFIMEYHKHLEIEEAKKMLKDYAQCTDKQKHELNKYI